MWLGIASVVIGYILGSIPSAYIVTRLRKGVDIREVDATGNVGAGSVFRQVGLWEGAIVAAADIAKGAVAILIAQFLHVSEPWVLAAGFAVVLGHSFPPYISFRGGQGVAALIGVYLVLAPLAMAVTLVLMGIVLLLIRNIFLMICIVGPLLPLIVWIFHGSTLLILYSLAIVIFLALRSRRGFQQFKEIKLVKPRIPNPFKRD
ncbi:MAG: hypothetical protein FJ006_11360 [Chloroflexi bacterium]|nr:hypothetical protein [Chloroflexota bacterium]